MKNEKIKIFNNRDKKINYDVLIKFDYDNNNYIIYTDNTYNDKGEFNLYGAMIDKENKLNSVYDVDVIAIFNKLIAEYKDKIIKGAV